MRWWRGPVATPSPGAREASARFDQVTRDDARVDRLDREVKRVQRQNNLGPAISRALRARRP